MLRTLLAAIATLDADIAEQLQLHPDAFIFQSLPRSGTVRAAAMLAEIGYSQARFPTPDSLAALAGAVPSTRSCGKHRVVTFRWACDKKLRDALVDFAQDSVRANPWADNLYRRHRARARPTPTQPASSRALGWASSGAAGVTASRMTVPDIVLCNAFSRWQLDLGLLIRDLLCRLRPQGSSPCFASAWADAPSPVSPPSDPDHRSKAKHEGRSLTTSP